MENKANQKNIKRNFINNLKKQIKLTVQRNEEEMIKNCQFLKAEAEKSVRLEEHEETLKEFMILSKFKEISSQGSFNACFKVSEKIGEGAHSSVYRCIEKHTGKVYAAKFFKKMDPELFLAVKETYQIMK